MVEHTLWHPAAGLADLTGDGPHAVTLLDTPVVLWRHPQDGWLAWKDQCPHRGARLSLGRVQGDRLECPYHGWRFDRQARCVLVPSQPDWQPPPSHCATAFETAQAHGLLWVKLQPSEHAVPAFEWEDDPALRKVLVGPYDVATSAPRLVENFLDMAHFGFVHEDWLGDREHTQQAPYEVQEVPGGLLAPDCPVWQPQPFPGATQGAMVSYRYEVRAPYYTLLSKNDARTVNVIALFICPVSQESSRAWFRMAATPDGSSDEALIAFQDTIFQQDKPIVESQQPRRLPLSGGERHGPLDRISAAYRRYLKRMDVSFGVLA